MEAKRRSRDVGQKVKSNTMSVKELCVSKIEQLMCWECADVDFEAANRKTSYQHRKEIARRRVRKARREKKDSKKD